MPRNWESRFFLSFFWIPALACTLQLGRNTFRNYAKNLRNSK